MTRKSIYPPDAGKDPFVYDGTPRARVSEAIVSRFTAGESIGELSTDFGLEDWEIGYILRWWICRQKARVRT